MSHKIPAERVLKASGLKPDVLVVREDHANEEIQTAVNSSNDEAATYLQNVYDRLEDMFRIDSHHHDMDDYWQIQHELERLLPEIETKIWELENEESC